MFEASTDASLVTGDVTFPAFGAPFVLEAINSSSGAMDFGTAAAALAPPPLLGGVSYTSTLPYTRRQDISADSSGRRVWGRYELLSSHFRRLLLEERLEGIVGHWDAHSDGEDHEAEVVAYIACHGGDALVER